MRTYLPQLTWLRGIASILVIFSHILRSTEDVYNTVDTPNTYIFYKALDLGTFGVLLFFVLSGCTLYISYSKKINSYQAAIIYIQKRILRIWPAFLVSLLIYSIFRLFFSSNYIPPIQNWIEYQFLSPVDLSDYFYYLTLTFNHFGDSGKFNNAFWSLPVEFQYYLLFPILIYLMNKSGLISIIAISVLLYFIPNLIQLDGNIDTRFFTLAYSFIGGFSLGYLYPYINKFFQLKNIPALLLMFLILFLVSLVTNDWVILPDITFISNKWNFYGIFALLIVAINLTWQANLNSKLASTLKWLGDISYSAYLYHNLVIALTILIIINFELYQYKLLILVPSTFIITLCIAHYSYKYIEQFGIRMAKKI